MTSHNTTIVMYKRYQWAVCYKQYLVRDMSDLKTEPVKDQEPEQKDLAEFQTPIPQDAIETEKKETMPKSTFVFQSGNDRKAKQ